MGEVYCILYKNTKGEWIRMATRYTDYDKADDDLMTLLFRGRSGLEARIEEVDEADASRAALEKANEQC